MRRIRSFCFRLFVVAQFQVASPVHVDGVVIVLVVVSFVRDPVLFILSVAMLVAVVFPDFLVIVPGVASVSGLLVTVSWVIAVLILIGLFHINTVLSLSLFLSQSPACLLRISFYYCCSSAILALSLLPACVVSSFLELVPAYVVLECAPAPSSMLILLQYMVLVCLSCVVSI